MSKSENNIASYATIGFGNIGRALGKAFARNGIEVSVATTRDPTTAAFYQTGESGNPQINRHFAAFLILRSFKKG
jgi:predicted dinucleotide-binding enzyme